jgi:hypothetical protein
MGRGAIPSRRGFSRGAMRHPGVSGITRPFGRLSRGRGQVLHVLLSRSPLASLRRGVPFDLHVLGAPPAFILSQDRTLRPKMYGPRARPVLTTFTLIGSVRFIWFCLIGKGISRGRLSAALRKTIQVRPFQMVRCLPGCDTSGVSILAVSGSQGARLRGPSGPTGPRGKEIYCQTGGAPGAGIWAYTFPTQFGILSCIYQ